MTASLPSRGLHVAPVLRPPARYAVGAWHYSGSLPSGRCLYFGVWFDGAFIGVVVISRGAASNIGRPFGLGQNQIAEVTRIALRPGHIPPVSQVLAVVVRLLHKQSPGLRILISYADPRHGHDGRGAYAGANWIYLGQTQRERLIILHGKATHARTVSSKYGTRSLVWLRATVDPQAEHLLELPKHKYALGLTPAMREWLALLAKPYPTRPKVAGVSGCPADLAGAMPSRPLLHPREAAR